LGVEIAIAPKVGDGVDGPGDVPDSHHAKEHAPYEPTQAKPQSAHQAGAAQRSDHGTAREKGGPLRALNQALRPWPLEPLVEAVLKKIARVAIVRADIINDRVVDERPADVAPEKAGPRTVRVARLIRVLVVHAVNGHPAHRAALPTAHSQEGQ